MIKQIKFVSVPVADQDRALDFYTEKLGFTIITDQPFDDKQRWIELRVPKAETRVVLFTTDEDKGRIGTFMNMSYTCDDLQKTYEELKKRGVEFENPPKKEHWGNFAIFKDSEGNRFVLGDCVRGDLILSRRQSFALNGVDPAGAARRQEAGEKCDESESTNCDRERGQIQCANLYSTACNAWLAAIAPMSPRTMPMQMSNAP